MSDFGLNNAFFQNFDLGSIDFSSLPPGTQDAVFDSGLFDANGNYTGQTYATPNTNVSTTPATTNTSPFVNTDSGSPPDTSGSNTPPSDDTTDAISGLSDDDRQNLIDQGIIDADGNVLINANDFNPFSGDFNITINSNANAPPNEAAILADRDAILACSPKFGPRRLRESG